MAYFSRNIPISIIQGFFGIGNDPNYPLVNCYIMLLMGKSTISMVIFNSYVSHYQRLNLHFPMVFLWVFLWFSYGLPEGISTAHGVFPWRAAQDSFPTPLSWSRTRCGARQPCRRLMDRDQPGAPSCSKLFQAVIHRIYQKNYILSITKYIYIYLLIYVMVTVNVVNS